ncbi:serine hydrolase domain-containing protein [Brassicibacter mesophilus]|uniref:serine hydrolase domain-containing protein n=1 Tax=Brassicibacter mesophilus TaxID=745119 RepID=UPI003D229B13
MRDNWPTNDWIKLEPQKVGMNYDKFISADREIVKNLKHVNSFLVIRNGYLVFEEYYNGTDANTLNPVNSITKSIISLLIGIAIEKRYIKNVNQKLIEFLPEYENDIGNSLIGEIAISHLLKMGAGFEWESADFKEPLLKNMIKSSDWIKYILNIPLNRDRIGKFEYNSGVSHLLSVIITKAIGMRTQDFANKFLLQSIGVEGIRDTEINKTYYLNSTKWTRKRQWDIDSQGINIGGFGLSFKSRDLAKIGYLIINNGIWENKQVVSKEWIINSTKPHIDVQGMMKYGYHWWVMDRKNIKIIFALGYGGQYLAIIPQLDLITVITSENDIDCDSNRDPGYILYKYVLKALE